jgi:type IV secretory pathway VirB10-like protein
MDESQITGAASSYARKYALNGLFLIDDTKDADHESNYEGEKKAAPSKPKPAPPQKKPSAPAAPAKPAPKAPEPVPVNPDAPPNPEERITDQQRVALWDIARKAKYSQEQVKEVLAACGYEGTGSIKQKHYIVICEAISGTPVEQIGNIKKQLIALTKEN